MVTAKTFKPDFSKVNPYEDAPEEYFERIRGTQAYKTAVKMGWITDVPKPEVEGEPPPEPVKIPGIPKVIRTAKEFEEAYGYPVTQPFGKALTIEDLARQYNIPVAQFVSQAELEDLALPPEQRKVKWLIPYEQYLTSAQAKVLGLQAPEGSVVKMSPLTEGEPTFTLLRGEEAPPELKPEIIQMLKDIYPERFVPGTSYGITEAQLPTIVLDQIYSTLQTDYQGFVNDLYERIGEDETARFLKTLGVSEEYVLGALSYEKQNERITQTVQSVFPDYEIKDLVKLLATDEGLSDFLQDIRTESGVSWTDKRTLLEQLDFEPAEINEILRYRRTVVPIDGIRQLITVDINTQAAYDADGDFMGKYNPATKEFTKAPDKNIFQNMWDTLTFSSRQYWESFEGFVIGVLPEIIYSEIPLDKSKRSPVEKLFSDDMVNFLNETNRQQRENWRFAYAQNKADYDIWVEKHPEIRPKTVYQEGAFQHPELLKDPDYWAYEVANIIPLMLAMMAVGVGTGGTGIPFLALSTAGMGAVEGGAIYEDLINAGAPRDKAANISLIAGGIIGSLESVGRIPLLKQISPALFGAFKKRAGSELAKRGLAETINRFGRNFTIAQFAEVSTEMSQEVIGNVAVGFFDENRGAFENIGDIAVKTAVATFPLAVLGGATSIRMVKPSEMKGLSDATKKAKGWLQDNKGNWYEAVKEAIKEERGAIELPGKAEEAKPEVTKRTFIGITKSTDPTQQRAPWRVAYEYKGEEHASHETSKAKAIQFARDKLGVELDPETLKPIFATEVTPAPEVTREQLVEQYKKIATRHSPEVIDYVSKLSDEEVNALYRGKPAETITIADKKYYKTTLASIKGELDNYIGGVEKQPAIPKAEAGMPEAGYQPAMIEGVTEREVRPAGKGKIVQISMEDQLKLDQARRAAEEAPEEVREAYEAQAEIEGLKEWLATEPAAKLTNLIKKIGWYKGEVKNLTLKQYRDLTGKTEIKPNILTPDKKHVRWEYAIDDVATEMGYESGEVLKAEIERAGEARTKIKELETKIKTLETEPLPSLPEPTPGEVAMSPTGEKMLTPAQVAKTLELFGKYVESSSTIDAWELTRELRRETRAGQAEILKARAQELIVEKGVPAEEAMNQAIREALSGELPVARTDYLSDLTDQMRGVLFNKVYQTLREEPFEMASTLTALTNALTGRAIPRELGVKGGSAYTRLQRVFGDQPKVLKALDKMASEKKPLDDIFEGIYHETGREPIPIDAETAEYLRNLSDIPFGYKMLLEEPWKPPPPLPPDTRTAQQKRIDLENFKLELTPDTYKDWSPERLELLSYLRVNLLKEEYQAKLIEEKWMPPPPVSDTRTPAQRALDLVLFKIEMAKPPVPVTKFDAPIEETFKQPAFKGWTIGEKQMIVRVLKEAGLDIVDIGNLIRANVASVDNSFLRQSKVLATGHPLIGAAGHQAAWQSMFSQKHAEAEWQLIMRDPDLAIYEEVRARSGADPLRVPAFVNEKGTARYRRAEEYGFPGGERFIPRLTAKIPWIKLSERAFVAGTNKIVWGVWKSKLRLAHRMAERIASGEMKLAEGESFDIVQEMIDHQKMLANLIQRASLGRLQGLAPEISAIFFAARAKLGRWFFPIHLTGLSIQNKQVRFNPRVMREAWRDFFLMNAFWGGLMFLGGWLDLWDTEKDPRNAEFMSARIGKIRIDPWSGYRQFVVLYARLVTETGISSVTGAEYEVNKLGALGNFFRSSLSPMLSTLVDFWTGRNFLGQVVEITNGRQWLERVMPFLIKDVWDAYEEEGIKGAAIAIVPGIYGEGVQTYTGDWEDNFTKMGMPKYLENTAYGITEPRYGTADFWADTAGQFKDVDPATLTKEKGFPAYIRDMVETKRILEEVQTIPNEKLVSLNADPAKDEPTFIQYYQRWRDREALVAAGDKARFVDKELQPDGKYKEVIYEGDKAVTAFDKKYPRNYLGNMTQNQFALLNEYWSITDKKKQAEFLEKNKAEIGADLRQDWLRSHPTENARLALYGQADILTKEAYNQYRAMLKTFDYPNSAIPEMTLPPEGSIDNYFQYQDMENKNSWEAQLMLAKDPDLLKFLDRQPIDTPIASLELKVKNRANFDKLDAFSDKDSPDYIADEKKRDEAVKKLKVGTEFGDDLRRIEAIEKMGLSPAEEQRLITLPEPITPTMSAVKQFLAGDKVNERPYTENEYRCQDYSLDVLDNARREGLVLTGATIGFIDPDVISTLIREGRTSELRNRDVSHALLSVQINGQDYYIEPQTDEIMTEKELRDYWGQQGKPILSISVDTEGLWEQAARKHGVGANLELATAAFESRRDALVQAYVDRGRLIDQEGVGSGSAEVMLQRVDNPDFDKWLTDKDIWGDKALEPIDESRIPIWRIDVKYAKEDAEYEAIKSPLSAEQARLRQEYLEANPEYRMDRRRREAYSLANSATGEKFPAGLVESYVAYYEYGDKGFRRERFLVENPGFAEAMHRIAGIDLPDPAKVPSVEYDNIIEEWEDDFNKWSGLADNESESYIEDVEARKAEQARMKFTTADSVFSGVTFYGTKRMTGFGLAMVTRDAHYDLKGLQDNPNYQNYVATYVQYYKLQSEGKPRKWEDKTKTDKWYEDDWFLMENLDFYRDVYVGVLGNQRKDFRKVPTRGVFNQYLQYLKEGEGTPRYDYRWNHRELDAWLVDAFGYTPITEKKRREEVTSPKKAEERLAEQETEWDRQLAEIEKILAS